eukprot:146908-Prymnesium_polylepis.2
MPSRARGALWRRMARRKRMPWRVAGQSHLLLELLTVGVRVLVRERPREGWHLLLELNNYGTAMTTATATDSTPAPRAALRLHAWFSPNGTATTTATNDGGAPASLRTAL